MALAAAATGSALPRPASFVAAACPFFCVNALLTLRVSPPESWFCPCISMTAAIRKVFVEKPGEFDPRKYLGPARDEMKKLYEHKIVDVLGSNGKAE